MYVRVRMFCTIQFLSSVFTTKLLIQTEYILTLLVYVHMHVLYTVEILAEFEPSNCLSKLNNY